MKENVVLSWNLFLPIHVSACLRFFLLNLSAEINVQQTLIWTPRGQRWWVSQATSCLLFSCCCEAADLLSSEQQRAAPERSSVSLRDVLSSQLHVGVVGVVGGGCFNCLNMCNLSTSKWKSKNKSETTTFGDLYAQLLRNTFTFPIISAKSERVTLDYTSKSIC